MVYRKMRKGKRKGAGGRGGGRDDTKFHYYLATQGTYRRSR